MDFETFPDPYDADILPDTIWNSVPIADLLAIPLPLGATFGVPGTDDFFFNNVLQYSEDTTTASRFTELPLDSGNDALESQDAWAFQQTHGPAMDASQELSDPLSVAPAEPLEPQQLVVAPISVSPRR
jgi:hypothetical protein